MPYRKKILDEVTPILGEMGYKIIKSDNNQSTADRVSVQSCFSSYQNHTIQGNMYCSGESTIIRINQSNHRIILSLLFILHRVVEFAP